MTLVPGNTRAARSLLKAAIGDPENVNSLSRLTGFDICGMAPALQGVI